MHLNNKCNLVVVAQRLLGRKKYNKNNYKENIMHSGGVYMLL